jgi:hypothetical protein
VVHVSGNTNCIDGQGPAIKQSRTVAAFRGIEVRGSADVILHQGAHRPLQIEGAKQVLDRLRTEVSGDRLVIRLRGCVTNTGPIRVHAWSTSPNAVRIAGSGDVTGKTPMTSPNFDIHIAGSGDVSLELRSKTVNTHIAGSGNVTLRGTADQQSIKIAGSGDVRGSGLITRKIDARVVGSGNASVNATGTIQATIIGSGNLRHRGGATVTKRIIGSGSISAL